MTPPPLQITCKEFAELVTAHEAVSYTHLTLPTKA